MDALKEWREREVSEKNYQVDVKDNRGRGRQKRKQIDGVKGCLNVRELAIQETKECVKDKRK